MNTSGGIADLGCIIVRTSRAEKVQTIRLLDQETPNGHRALSLQVTGKRIPHEARAAGLRISAKFPGDFADRPEGYVSYTRSRNLHRLVNLYCRANV
jgi:hypothetical protein